MFVVFTFFFQLPFPFVLNFHNQWLYPLSHVCAGQGFKMVLVFRKLIWCGFCTEQQIITVVDKRKKTHLHSLLCQFSAGSFLQQFGFLSCFSTFFFCICILGVFVHWQNQTQIFCGRRHSTHYSSLGPCPACLVTHPQLSDNEAGQETKAMKRKYDSKQAAVNMDWGSVGKKQQNEAVAGSKSRAHCLTVSEVVERGGCLCA